MSGDRPLHIVDWYDGVLSGCWIDKDFRYLGFHHVVVWEINKFRIALEFEASTDDVLPPTLRDHNPAELDDGTYDLAWKSYCRAHHKALTESTRGSVVVEPLHAEDCRFEGIEASTWDAIKERFATATADLASCTEAGWGSLTTDAQEHLDWLMNLLNGRR